VAALFLLMWGVVSTACVNFLSDWATPMFSAHLFHARAATHTHSVTRARTHTHTHTHTHTQKQRHTYTQCAILGSSHNRASIVGEHNEVDVLFVALLRLHMGRNNYACRYLSTDG